MADCRRPRWDKEPIGSLLLKIEQGARLLGLDAPTKVKQTTLEDPEVAARRERQMEILDKLTLKERQEPLLILQGKSTSDCGDSAELEK